MAREHARIVQHPLAASIQGALLDSYEEKQCGGQLHLTLNIRGLEVASSELFGRKGILHERVRGRYIPAAIRFSGVAELKSGRFYTNLASLPRNDPTRTINGLLAWRQPGRQEVFYLFFMRSAENLMFFARDATQERFIRGSTPVTLERDWSPPPLMPGRLIPRPEALHQRFGGDPVTIKVNGQVRHQKLFIGGTDIQPKHRPQVDAVLNLGEKPSRWVKSGILHPGDRAENKGEGPQGMSIDEICEEANWVIARLRKNESVLVHCAAGMNRSATICCAALMLMEGLGAEEALQRVREHHPWARPDSYHWLKLRWMATSRKGDL